MTPNAIRPGTPVLLATLTVAETALGTGGQGAVHATTAEYDGAPLVFKRYNSSARTSLDAGALERMTRAVAALDDHDRKQWLGVFAWPLCTVIDGGSTLGFLMPAVPDGFYTTLRTGTRTRRVLAELQHLLNSAAFISARGIVLSRRDQFQLLVAVAEALTLLHRNGFAVGDLSPRNLLFSTAGDHARVYFVDCDAMATHTSSATPQAETPGWGLPPGEPLATQAGDSYKFGLLALRLLAGDQDTRDPSQVPLDAGSLQPLVQRALTAAPDQRPKPADWIPSLIVAARRASTAPLDSTDARDVVAGDRQRAPDTPATPPGAATLPHATTATPIAGPGPATWAPAYNQAVGPAALSAPTHPGQPAQRRNTGAIVIALAVVAGLVGVGSWLLVKDARSPDGAVTQDDTGPSTTQVSTPPVTSDTYDPPQASPSTPSSTPPVPAAGPPAGTTGEYCGTTPFRYRANDDTEYVALNITVGATVPATHCNFARVVARDVHESSDTHFPITVTSTSPNTGSPYTMTCRSLDDDPIVLRCSDGRTAEVYFYH